MVFSYLGGASWRKVSQEQQQQQEEKSAKTILFYGFQTLRWAFSGCKFDASLSFTAMVFPQNV